jgi:hypothetical protein
MTAPRTFPVLLALGLAAIVALPAATALNLASQGNAASDAVLTGAAGGGGEYRCMSTRCNGLGAGSLGGESAVSSRTAWRADLQADADAQAVLDAAEEAAAQARAEVEARAREALDARDRVDLDVEARHNARATTDADAAMDTRADLRGDAGIDGILSLRGDRDVDMRQGKALKHKAEAEVGAQVEGATDVLAQLLAELQGALEGGVQAAVDVAAQVGSSVGTALGLVQGTQVELHHSVDAAASLGTVPSIEVPRIEAPDLALDGNAELVAEAQAAAQGVIRS